MILLEDSDTGGPSSITDRMEYLFAFWGGGAEGLLSIFVPGITQGY